LAFKLGVNEEIINRAPTAGLWPNQTDEKELGVKYEDIDKVISGEKIQKASAEIIQKLHETSEHKRANISQPDKIKRV
jgi:NAD+ synthase